MNETAILVSLKQGRSWHIPVNGSLTYCGIGRPHDGWHDVCAIDNTRGEICQKCITEKERSMYVNQR